MIPLMSLITIGLRRANPDAVNLYRPEGGSYASNLAAANTLFNTRLQDRQGGSWYTDPAIGERHMTSLWLRTSGGHSKGRMSDDQNTSSSNRVVVQIGGALLQGSVNGTDGYQLGVMAGYGKQDNDIHNGLSGYDSHGEVSGYSAGLYGTWYQTPWIKPACMSIHGYSITGLTIRLKVMRLLRKAIKARG